MVMNSMNDTESEKRNDCEILEHLMAVAYDMEPVGRMIFALSTRAHERGDHLGA